MEGSHLTLREENASGRDNAAESQTSNYLERFSPRYLPITFIARPGKLLHPHIPPLPTPLTPLNVPLQDSFRLH
jgi:hypothetical protein